MRVLAVLWLFVIATNYLGIIRGIEGANIPFACSDATSETYSNFIKLLRTDLAAGGKQSHGIPVLQKTVGKLKRFILVDLTNYGGNTVTVAIDVLNVYVVGYKTSGNRSYFLRQDDSTVPITDLFKGTTPVNFTFTGSYTDLQRIADRKREHIPLGVSELSVAIDRLLDKKYNKLSSVAVSLIVIIQMVSEVARFGFIESQIAPIIHDGEKTYTPGSYTLDMETEWSTLSKQIQASGKDGRFKTAVKIGDNSVNNVQTAKDVTGIALLLDPSRSRAAGGDHDVKITVSSFIRQANNDNSRVWRQRWAFYGDGTIRVNNDRSLCLTLTMDVGIIIRKCEGLGNQHWVLRTDGSILNPKANNLVMDVKESNVSPHHIILNQPNQKYLRVRT